MKELDIKASNELIEVYERYFYEGLTDDVQMKAKETYDEYHPASTMMDDRINTAVGKLFPLAYPDSGSGMDPPSKNDVRHLITGLERLRMDLDGT